MSIMQQQRQAAWELARAEAIRVAVYGSDYDPSSDIFLSALDPAEDAPAQPVVVFSSHRKSTRMPKPAKQAKNEKRTWPDWRTMPEDRAIEHDRSGEGE